MYDAVTEQSVIRGHQKYIASCEWTLSLIELSAISVSKNCDSVYYKPKTNRIGMILC